MSLLAIKCGCGWVAWAVFSFFLFLGGGRLGQHVGGSI